MCGIVGAVAQRNVVPILIEGLQRLEYRGYDSAGIAVRQQDGGLGRIRAVGKVAMLRQLLETNPVSGNLGIAHTRWATHGMPAERNAHPHMSGEKVAVVHNGIIENHAELRAELQAKGYFFTSETDTEVIAHLLAHLQTDEPDLLRAVQKAIKQLVGAYGLAVCTPEDADRLIVARAGSPLVIGLGIGENFIASDVFALLPVTQRFIFLEEGDVAEIRRDGVRVFDVAGNPVERQERLSQLSASTTDKGPYKHYMLKEIFEQPSVIAETLVMQQRVEQRALPIARAGMRHQTCRLVDDQDRLVLVNDVQADVFRLVGVFLGQRFRRHLHILAAPHLLFPACRQAAQQDMAGLDPALQAVARVFRQQLGQTLVESFAGMLHGDGEG